MAKERSRFTQEATALTVSDLEKAKAVRLSMKCGVRETSRRTGYPRSSITRWRKDARYMTVARNAREQRLRSKSKNEIESALRRHKAGESLASIAKSMDVSKVAVHHWVKSERLDPMKFKLTCDEDIQNSRKFSIEIDGEKLLGVSSVSIKIGSFPIIEYDAAISDPAAIEKLKASGWEAVGYS